jgi:hypothetical protein
MPDDRGPGGAVTKVEQAAELPLDGFGAHLRAVAETAEIDVHPRSADELTGPNRYGAVFGDADAHWPLLRQ